MQPEEDVWRCEYCGQKVCQCEEDPMLMDDDE